MQDFGLLLDRYVSGLRQRGMTVRVAKTHDIRSA